MWFSEMNACPKALRPQVQMTINGGCLSFIDKINLSRLQPGLKISDETFWINLFPRPLKVDGAFVFTPVLSVWV